MELDYDISTAKGSKEWCDFFMSIPKEQLVDVIIHQMYKDRYFVKEIQSRFSKPVGTVEEIINSYVSNIKMEMSENIPNVDYLETLSESMMDTAAESEDIIVKLRMYMIVISELTEAMNGGAGYHYENEFILDGIMETCADEIVENMKNKQAILAVDEYQEVYNFLTKEVANNADCYQISKLLEKINE